MKKRTLWTFGCSFTAEYFPVDFPHMKSNYDDYKSWRGGNLPKIWPTLLGEFLDYDVKNCASGGSSNHSIFSKFIEEHKNFEKDDLVIIGWTNLLRFRAYNKKDNTMNDILPSFINTFGTDLFSDNTLIEIFDNRSHPVWAKELWQWVSLINTTCRLLDVKILHWNSDDTFFSKKYIDHDEVKTFITSPDGNLDVFEYSRRLYADGKYTMEFETSGDVMDLHSGEFGHISQAKYFHEYINNLVKMI